MVHLVNHRHVLEGIFPRLQLGEGLFTFGLAWLLKPLSAGVVIQLLDVENLLDTVRLGDEFLNQLFLDRSSPEVIAD